MKIHKKTLQIRTENKIGLSDITVDVRKAIEESGLKEGIAVIFSPHTTTALLINENEPRLIGDFLEGLKDLINWQKNYAHNQIDNNAASHISGAFIGGDLSLLVSEGQLDLGTWQSIFLLELDGPRSRQVKVKVIGE